jgi:hypothetical protein
LNELEDVIREWVGLVYHHDRHDGLVDPNVPGLSLSPAQMFTHGMREAATLRSRKIQTWCTSSFRSSGERSSTTESSVAASAMPTKY